MELGKKGVFQTILDGHVDLMSAESFSCREVIAPVIDKGGNDFLTETADSFTFDFLFNRRPDLLDKTYYKYTPYVKNNPSNAEIAVAVFQLISLIITMADTIEKLIEAVVNLAVFGIIVLAAYVFFLLQTSILLTQAILDMVLGPVKYHACMSALQLCQIGAEYKGYQFASTILEGDYENLVIIPPKNETIAEAGNDPFNLVTGFTQPNADEQVGYYSGTFGQLLRDLIVMFNGKIIIEESATGGQKIIRLERQDYNNSQKLYTLPDINFDQKHRKNTDEFAAATSLKYLTDSADINTYQFWSLANVLEVIEPVDVGGGYEYSNLFKGYNETTIPFSMAVRKDATRSRSEEIIISILDILAPLIEEVVFVFNTQTYKHYLNLGEAVDAINTINVLAGLPEIDTNLPDIEEILITIPDFRAYSGNREGVMYLENDQLNTHRVALLEEDYSVNLTQTSRSQLGQYGIDNDFPFATEELVDLLSGIETTGSSFLNTLSEDNNEKLSALTLYQSFHQINSFFPSTDRPKGNQWKVYEVDNVNFCYDDWQLLKTDNTFQNAQGEECLLESCEWFPFQNKANFKFRINSQYLTNIQLKDGTLIQSNGK